MNNENVLKKHVIAVLLVIVLCLTALSGCSLMKSFERDVQVVLEVDGEYYDTCTVNIFNNAVVTPPEVPSKFDGKNFVGWTAQQNWEELETKDIKVSSNKGLIRYDDVKDYLKGAERSITLQAVFVEIDLVIAWYDRGTTSGLDATVMAEFEKNMNAYLSESGYSPDGMYIVIRSYDGAVGASCAKIMSDGDVDIMVGWAANITSTGGMTPGTDFIENVGGITIGSTANRYAARITDTELTNLVFSWIVSKYGA